MTANRTYKYRLKAWSVHLFFFPCLHGQAEFTVSVFLNGASVISDVLSNYFTCMCIYRLKYLQVKEVGNVVKIVSLTVFHSLKHLWQGHFYFTFSVFWWPEFRWQKIIRLNLLVFSFVWCQDHINYFGSAANLLLKSTSKMISWNRSVLVWWSIYWKATPHLPFVKVFT